MTDRLDEWRTLQTIGKSKLSITEYPIDTLATIGAYDISYLQSDPNKGYVTLTLSTYPDMQPYYQESRLMSTTVPYISGFLAFRESELICSHFNEFRKARPDILAPDLLLIDGSGIYHERGFGLASQVGLELGIPTIGIAKTPILLPGLEDIQTRCSDFWKVNPPETPMPITNNVTGETYGYALRTTGSKKPHFVSPGHLITVEQAYKVVQICRNMPNMDPIRLSDHGGRVLCGQI